MHWRPPWIMIIGLFAIAAGGRASAQLAPIVIDSNFQYLMLDSQARYLEILEDTSNLEAVLALDDTDFKTVSKQGFFFGLQDKAHWFDFSILCEQDNQLLFEIVNPYLEEVHLYWMSGSKLLRADTLGAGRPFAQRSKRHRNWHVPISLKHGEEVRCLMYVPPTRGPLQLG